MNDLSSHNILYLARKPAGRPESETFLVRLVRNPKKMARSTPTERAV